MARKNILVIATFLICNFCNIFAAEQLKNSSIKEITKATPAELTMLVYIDADNSLADYAYYNVNDMAAGLTASSNINVLVQWDKPENNISWRYKIVPGGKVDVGSIQSEMGYDPSNELVTSMRWAIQNYPANRYALILWDHGSGIEDFYPATTKKLLPSSGWLGMLPTSIQRGILYDDSQKTCLTNQGLTNALTQIKQTLGKNLDLIAMDACLMAMTEVAYQMSGLVNIFVGSQQTIPGSGYPYSMFLKPLSLNPVGTTTLQLAQNMISSYKSFYTKTEPTPDFTLSAIDVTSINLIKQNIDQFINAVAACGTIDAAKTKTMIVKARRASISFEMPEYIDLYSFYANVMNQAKTLSPKSAFILEKQNRPVRPRPKPTTTTTAYQKALNTLTAVLQDGLTKIGKVVLQKASGPVYAGTKGISIYYPSDGYIDSSYPQTLFAKNTSWQQFIKLYH